MVRAVYFALVVVTAVAFGTLFVQSRNLAAQGNDAHQAICALRTDLEQRVENAQTFLLTHPQGIPGIPVSVIRNGLTNQQKTIDALRHLNCP
jgi:hypothetical protein